ncbi:MAG: RHS repeat-associated core domain-containing protein, partial [Prevotellaceae bacterium]|nr:RHS repeat-associated core domain-containing protein [Prevotellaceae bacterium]
NGDITAQYNYYPFGKIWESAGTQAPTTRYLFSGKERQTVRDLGYFDFGARMYDGNTGRWFVTDPMAEMYYGISPYAYCANNPVNYIDPDGMQITETADGWTITGDDIDSFWGWLTSVMTSVSNDGGGGGGSGGGITYPIFGGTEHRGSGSGSWLMDAFFGSQMYYGGELEPAVCTAQAPDWMNNTRYQDTYNPNIVYPKETFLEGALRLVTGIDNRIGYDQDGNAYKHVQPVTGMPPLPGLVKGVSVIKTGAKIISSSTKVISNSEKVAKALKLNINSPTTQQIINNLDKTVESFIGLFRQASITSKFPGEFLNMTIKEALKSGNTTVRKLLTDRRFVK